MLLLSPLLAAMVFAQAQPEGITGGAVVDNQGKPVSGARVVLSAPFLFDPIIIETRTDAEGRFRLADPPHGPFVHVWASRPGSPQGPFVHVWASRPGSAIAAAQIARLGAGIVMRKPEARAVKLEGPDGKPIVGARIAPRVISFVAAPNAPGLWIPETLVEALTVTTGPAGRAMFGSLRAGDRLVAVRVTADSIGTQDIPLVADARPNRADSSITVRLKPTGRLAGRVVDGMDKAVVDQPVEVWFKGEVLGSTNPGPVGFTGGSPRTSADGSFQTPDQLLIGSPYRIVVRGAGLEPIISDWITIAESPRTLPPMVLRPLRSIAGRVVDHQDRPVAGVEVFQSGDGPERTSTRTDADGRFSLRGFRQGTVFLFARGEGFRFHGQMVKGDEGAFTIKLTRFRERPVRRMRMLAEPVPLEESRALARRLIEPYWKAALEKAHLPRQRIALKSMATADPVGILERLEAAQFPGQRLRPIVLANVIAPLSLTDPEQAATVAGSISDPDLRAEALLQVIDALPEGQRDRKLALLDRAEQAARAGTDPGNRMLRMGDVAEHWYVLGAIEKARPLFAEGLSLANPLAAKDDFRRGLFAARLARVDLPAALAIARDFPERSAEGRQSVLNNIAFHLAGENPAEAERVLKQVPRVKGRYKLPPRIIGRMAAVDPGRARRLVDESQQYDDNPTKYLFLALGLKSRDEAAVHEAFQVALRGIDRLMKERAEYSAFGGLRGALLPVVERIDPVLVPELFWRIVATRPPIGRPQVLREHLSAHLVPLLAWYDREVAEALFERVRGEIDRSANRELTADRTLELLFRGWAMFDPRAAVARLEKVAVDPRFEPNADRGRLSLAEILGLPYEPRWRRVWGDQTDLPELYERDIQ